MKKATAIIQARMASTRLPNKVMLKIEGEEVLKFVIRQVKASKFVNKIIIATTKASNDDKIFKFCKKNKIDCFRGSEKDVLDRYYQCAKKFSCDIIVRISADSPFIDPEIIDKTIEKYVKNSYDYVSTNIEKKGKTWRNSSCNFPQGNSVEICSFKILEKIWKKAKKPSEREHVFPYIQFNSNRYKIKNLKNNKDFSYIRCTIDRLEDLKFIREIHNRLPKRKRIIHMNDIVKIVIKNPELVKINGDIPFDEGYKKSLKEDEKILKKN